MIDNNKINKIDFKNCTYYCSDEMINVKDFNPKSINVDNKFDQGILNYYTGYETSDGVKPLYIIFNEINRFIENNKGSENL